MGTPYAAAVSLERLISDGHEIAAVYTQPDRPAGRGNKIVQPPVKELALQHDLPVLQPTKLRTAEAAAEFASLRADIAIVVAYGRILPDAMLNAFPKGAMNVHFSLLPKYRGAAPVNWAIANGEKVTGVTTMQMDSGLDTGDILLQSETVIGDEETAIELMDRLAVLGAELMAATLAKFDQLKPITQDHQAATLAPIMSKSDGRIDWSMTAEQIANRIRGFQPFPRSYSDLRGQRVVFWKAGIRSTLSDPSSGSQLEQPAPGEIIEIGRESLIINCGGSTLLEVFELQPEGKRRMPARDFINGSKPTASELFI